MKVKYSPITYHGGDLTSLTVVSERVFISKSDFSIFFAKYKFSRKLRRAFSSVFYIMLQLVQRFIENYNNKYIMFRVPKKMKSSKTVIFVLYPQPLYFIVSLSPTHFFNKDTKFSDTSTYSFSRRSTLNMSEHNFGKFRSFTQIEFGYYNVIQ